MLILFVVEVTLQSLPALVVLLINVVLLSPRCDVEQEGRFEHEGHRVRHLHWLQFLTDPTRVNKRSYAREVIMILWYLQP